MDLVRCKCPRDIHGALGRAHPSCALHGWSSPQPATPYTLTATDRLMLKQMRIAVTDAAEIEAVRKSDEQRFNPPRER